ncbi:alkylated DNA nucleotide flippase Atl1 [Paenibacillus sp. DS2363]|uniref:tail fiber protein n=1 Tax=Paenibacillus sp. DS2363 TaxID=3156427 RepID=UPI0033978B04
MSSWIYVLTNKGRQLQAKAQTGVKLEYTRMAVGSGTLAGQALSAMTALITPVKNLPIVRLKHPPGATRAVVGATLTNADVQTGFYFREIGIFATDPDEGEILYMYANAGSTADYIAPIGDGVIEKDVNMNVIVGSATNVTAIINESLVYVTHDELEEALENIVVEVNDASLTEKGIVQLSNKTDGISEKLAPTEKALGDVRKELKSSFTPNRIYNSSGELGLDGWLFGNVGIFVQELFDDRLACFRLDSSTANANTFIQTPAITLQTGQTFTLSAEFENLNGVAGQMFVQLRNGSTILAALSEDSTTTRHRKSVAVEIPAGASICYVRIGLIAGLAGAARRISKIMLAQGTNTEWNQAANDKTIFATVKKRNVWGEIL